MIGKLVAFVVTLCGGLWLAALVNPGFALRLSAVAAPVLDVFDYRPEKAILVLGNSRSYYNEMTAMLRAIADSDGAPERWEITLLAWGGAGMEENWKRSEVQAALNRRWAEVIVQGESRGSASQAQRASFLTYGAKMIAEAEAAHSPVGLVVNWGWGPQIFHAPTQAEAEAAADAYALQLEADHQTLAAETGARKIDANAAFRWLQQRRETPPLLADGNHPTAFGSYVLALAIYREVSRAPLHAGLWRPGDLTDEAALAAATAVESAATMR